MFFITFSLSELTTLPLFLDHVFSGRRSTSIPLFSLFAKRLQDGVRSTSLVRRWRKIEKEKEGKGRGRGAKERERCLKFQSSCPGPSFTIRHSYDTLSGPKISGSRNPRTASGPQKLDLVPANEERNLGSIRNAGQ